MKKKIAVTLILSVILFGICTIFTEKMTIKSFQLLASMDRSMGIETKSMLLGTTQIKKWVMPKQNIGGYASHQDGFSVYYDFGNAEMVNFSVPLEYGTVSVRLPRGMIANSTTDANTYAMEIPGNGIYYVALIENIVEVKQYGIYQRSTGSSPSWTLVDTYVETELLDQDFKRVEANNLSYYDYI